ncbi:MAG: CxxC-x17-CxxC domain-containing protein [Candidatus Magasanikbacteria bacterium]
MYNQGPRQMFDVDLSCAKCGTHISQLPFQPSGDRPVFCQDCNRANREQRDGGARPQKRMFDVDVKCAGCGTHITQLPFEPKAGSDLFCRECYLKNKDN